ncbi:hypothetical protein ASPFODRAFT_31996 [Aspergillus luchuensis CBS 106.47]|uniref:Fungal-type protein kinase domain-containing protein n=1 Tax=Aspergillus luchuensis (strain CBS 106.47) TaxID=1137211 RepID=A0A1M3TL09_ASPLC|nr:hypothetical protein ASPFODRAFT_31996 [Aspergillus luchuensis CBS 106.47]
METYNSNLSFNREHLAVLQNDSSAGNVSGMWLSILNHYFPTSKEYAHRPELYQKNMSGYTDITSVRWLGDNIADCRPFLVTQTKRNSDENSQSAWDTGESQLSRYIGAIEEGPNRKWYWGIVAIGSLVEFYKYNMHTGTLTRTKSKEQLSSPRLMEVVPLVSLVI